MGLIYKYMLHVAYIYIAASQVVLVIKIPPTNARDIRNGNSVPGLGRAPEGGSGYPLQYSYLAGYSPWGHKETDLTSTHTYVYTHMQKDSETPADSSVTHSFTKCAQKARSSETLRVGGGVGCTARKMINVLTFRDLPSNGGKWKMNSTCIPLGRFCIMIQVAEHIQESQDRE